MKRKILKTLKQNKNGMYSHLIVCYDPRDYEYYLENIRYDQDINEYIKELNNRNLNIQAIYNYNIDLDEQLIEDKPMNIEPIIKNEKNKVYMALEFAKKVHTNQIRIDGTPYINHPIRVAENVVNYIKSDDLKTLVIVAYLHDTIEDTKENKKATYNEILTKFGIKIASMVMELINDKELVKKLGKTKYLQHKFINLSCDSLNIKLCDRLDNVKDLIVAEEPFRRKYINETLEILEYLINNRELEKEQLVIISNIYETIAKYIEKDSKLMVKKLQ